MSGAAPGRWPAGSRRSQRPATGWNTGSWNASTVKAYENACRHRGVELAHDRGHSPGGFNCPFHGWHWNINGENTAVFQSPLFDPRTIDPADTRLPEVRLDTWGGCAFISFDRDAAPLRESLGNFAPMHEARNVDQLRARWWVAARVPANWKTVIEAFLESYHVPRTHPQLMSMLKSGGTQASEESVRKGGNTTMATRFQAYRSAQEVIDGSIAYMRNLSEGMGKSMIIDRDIEAAESLRGTKLPDDPMEAGAAWRTLLNDTITWRGREAGLPMFDLNAIPDSFASPVNYAFPNFFLLPVYGNMASYRIRPVGPEESIMEVWGLEFFPPGETPPKLATPEVWRHDDPRIPLIPAQDFSVIPPQQRGMHAPSFDYLRLASKREGLISNYQRLIDGYIAGASWADLTRAVTQVSGAIDAPVRPLGLGAD